MNTNVKMILSFLPDPLKESIKFWIYPLIIKTINFIKPIRGKDNKIVTTKSMVQNTGFKVQGDYNQILIAPNAKISNCNFNISGSNNQITIDPNSKFDGVSFVIAGDNCSITIGRGTSIYNNTHIAAIENNSQVIIGADCFISSQVDIRTGDSHSIIDRSSQKRINNAQSITIGNHVWICAKVDILKGTTISDNTVIGMKSIVTRAIPANCVAAGNPAVVVKNNTTWEA